MLEELKQYHFDREVFNRIFVDVFKDWKYLDKFEDVALSESKMIGPFCILKDDFDEWYFIHLPSGTIINWYKLSHVGRTNTCNKENFTEEDLTEFFTTLKIVIDMDA